MSFESGSISGRVCRVLRRLPDDIVERFARHAASPLERIGSEPTHGWVGGRHLLDVPITEENARWGGFLRVTLMKAERKIPTSLLRAECMLEELARMKADGKPFIDRKTRGQIRKQVTVRLLPAMPASLKGIPLVYDDRAMILYVGATTDNQMDAFSVNFRAATSQDCIPITAETAAAQLRKLDVRNWSKTSFAPDVTDSEMEEKPGQDFLTWLWFASEARGGLIESREHGQVGFSIDGPIVLERNGDGAHQTALRHGLPTVSAEAKTALLSGKKLRRAKLLIGRANESWSAGFEADTFVFRGLRLPDSPVVLDAASRFQDRMEKLGQFWSLIMELYNCFLEERSHPQKWAKTKSEIHEWMTKRSTRK